MSNLTLDVEYNKAFYKITVKIDNVGKFRDIAQARRWWEKYFKNFFENHNDIKPNEIKCINRYGVTIITNDLKKVKVLNHPDLLSLKNDKLLTTAQKADLFWKTTMQSFPKFKANILSRCISWLKSKIFTQKIPDDVNKEEPRLEGNNLADVDYKFLDKTHKLDQSYKPLSRWKSDSIQLLSKETLIELETAYLTMVYSKTNNNKKVSKTQIKETQKGVSLGIDSRKNYQMVVKLKDEHLQKFFSRKPTEPEGAIKPIVSTDIFAKNSPLNEASYCDQENNVHQIQDAVTSSYNRLADTLTLMRKIEAQDKSSDCYTGRADTREKAIELVKFIFLSEINTPKGKRKYINHTENGLYDYELTFAIQSLLTVSNLPHFNAEKKAFDLEQNAFNELPHIIEIVDHRTNIHYKVKITPIIVDTQFNIINKLKTFHAGTDTEQEVSEAGDKRLIDLAKRKFKSPDLLEIINVIENDLKDKSLKPWQIVMTRAYLCHLLNIPEVIHCKSNVDRTGGIAIPMVFAMKEWLRSRPKDIPIPKHIYEIVGKNLTNGSDQPVLDSSNNAIYPFKELFAYKMIHELKQTEFSRGRKGFKLKELAINPALYDLLPERYIDHHWGGFATFNEKNPDMILPNGKHRRLMY